MMVLRIWNKSLHFAGIPSYILAVKSSVFKIMTLLVAI